ncbi:MAG TPA: hypothetical protein VK641_06610 [Terriglobales bacterium]|nr:hypothetical protein [Terriglobales bacterium]
MHVHQNELRRHTGGRRILKERERFFTTARTEKLNGGTTLLEEQS